MSASTRTRFASADWIALGLDILRRHGAEAITIDKLCEHARKTKGSFYFHFPTMEAFSAALAQQWREKFTLSLIRQADAEANPGRALDYLGTLALHLDHRVEQAIRRLAVRDKGVAAIVAAVDEERVAYVASRYQASGRYNEAQARSLATIEYAAFVGLQQIMPDAHPDTLRALYDELQQLTGRLPRTGRQRRPGG